MRCDQAQQLFDAYLDGELAPSLSMELAAHRLRCPECRRALALLEVTGHVIRSDAGTPPLSEGFSERLMACVRPSQTRRLVHRVLCGAYVAGPLAAAAVVAMAFLGVFDRHDASTARVAGEKEIWTGTWDFLDEAREPGGSEAAVPADIELKDSAGHDPAFDDWLRRMQANVQAARESGESLQRALDLTVLQLLDVLEQASAGPPPPENSVESDAGSAPHVPPQADRGGS